MTDDAVRRSRLFARAVLDALGEPALMSVAVLEGADEERAAADRDRRRRFREADPAPSVLRNLGKLGGQLKTAVRALTGELREAKWRAVPDPPERGKRR